MHLHKFAYWYTVFSALFICKIRGKKYSIAVMKNSVHWVLVDFLPPNSIMQRPDINPSDRRFFSLKKYPLTIFCEKLQSSSEIDQLRVWCQNRLSRAVKTIFYVSKRLNFQCLFSAYSKGSSILKKLKIMTCFILG